MSSTSDGESERRQNKKSVRNVREKSNRKPKKTGDEKDSRSRKQNSSLTDDKSRSRRKNRYEDDSRDSRSSSTTTSSSATSDNSSQSSSSSDSSDSSSTSTASSSSRSSSASSAYRSKNRSKRYSRDKQSSKSIHEKKCRCKKCKERYADNTSRKSTLSKGKSHDARSSSKTTSRKREGGSADKQRRTRNDFDSSDEESDSSKHAGSRKHKGSGSKKSDDYVGDSKNRSKSNKGAAGNHYKSRDGSSQRDNSGPKNSSSASGNPTKQNQSSADSSSSNATPRQLAPTLQNTKDAGTTSSSTATPSLLTPRNTQSVGTTPYPVTRYEWQFQDNQGTWISYGKSSTESGGGPATTASSDDIEKHYNNDPAKSPVQIQSNSYQYVLDFQTMIQTNSQTSVQRRIRRVPKQAVKPVVLTKNNIASSGVGTTASTARVVYEWQFKDKHGAWIRYGSPNTDGDLSCVTTTSSDDIENHFSSDPDKTPLSIESNSYQYILDFEAMTQTNQETSVLRRIRRVAMQPGKRIVTPRPKQKYLSVRASNSSYEWQFQDENGAWIRYGSPNTAGDVLCVTTTNSDDIEKHYSNNPASTLTIQSNCHQYLLDFQSGTQTNQSTMSQRPIRRVLAQTSQNSASQSGFRQYLESRLAGNNGRQSALVYEWFFLDENNTWVPYGQPNSLNKTDCVTSVSSDDIERHYQQNPHQSIDIASQKHKYRLDFVNKTQTNMQTGAVRTICRISKTQPGLNASGRRSGLNSHSSSNSDSLPSNWASMAHSSSAWTAVPLNPYDQEYIKHVGIIKQAVTNFNVRRMYRVQNPFLWKAYVNKKDYMTKQHPGIRFREEHLYHGTDPKNVKAICEENIDWRLHGTSHGQSQGRGAYFAKSPQLATNYSGQQGVVFIVKVLVGHTTRGSSAIVKPPKDQSGLPYDTTVDNETNPTMFVKYDTQEYYPEYYVEF